MENKGLIEKTETFLKEVVMGELGKLQHAGLSYMQFVLMGQAIEVLGGFLDQKPMKAKGHGGKTLCCLCKISVRRTLSFTQ